VPSSVPQVSPGQGAGDRLQREAQFHDHAFAGDTRASTDRFYAVARRGYDEYRAAVRDGVPGLRVLEYGCGPGSEAFALAGAGARVDGIDISPVAIEMARAEAAREGVSGGCEFGVMNAEALAFPDATFDRICGSGILHHLDLAKGFAEIARTLEPGGRAIFVEPLGHNPAINWYRRRTPEMRTSDEHPLVAADFELARRHFRRVDARFFHLAVLAAVPFLRTPAFRAVHRAFDLVDGVLLARRSPLRWNAWLVLLTLEK
jgi:SAM-dependent methyltransferase